MISTCNYEYSKFIRESRKRDGGKSKAKYLIVQFFSLALFSSQNQIGRLLANTVVRVPVVRKKKKKYREKSKENLKYHKFTQESYYRRSCVCKNLKSRITGNSSSVYFSDKQLRFYTG